MVGEHYYVSYSRREIAHGKISPFITANFIMSTLKILVEVIRQIDRYRRHCLWLGGDLNARKPPLAAWKLVCKPKKKGGLGVIKLIVQNVALLLKNIDKKISRANLPWVNLIWSQYYSNGRVPGLIKRGSFGGEVF
jgi:hypothetical protein